MRVLSLDTAGHACSACVWQDGEVLAHIEERMERGQDARLVPLILEVMAQAKTGFAALDRIAVTRGPGSFTGLRIGLATARGMGLAANKHVIGIDRFSVFRHQMKEAENLLVVLDSKRQELFCRLYSLGETQEPCMMPIDEIATLAQSLPNLTLAGDANDLLRQQLPETVVLHPATESEAITSAVLASRAALDDPVFLPRPFYLRAPDVTVSAKQSVK